MGRRGLKGLAAAWCAVALLLSACGGGGGGAPANATASVPAGANVLAVRVDGGTDGRAFNIPLVTVTVCEPGGARCVDVPNVLVDTGSNGLRVAASALAGLALPAVTQPAGAVAQCANFVSGYTWGAVHEASVRLGGETTGSAIPIQVIGDTLPGIGGIPAACSSPLGQPRVNVGTGLGALGILGVGLADQDCGDACAIRSTDNVYFTCAAAGNCVPSALPLAQQVRNPVAALPVNNNGVVLSLPPVPTGGLASLEGTLVLGVGTQANNQLGGATVVRSDRNGYFTTTYQGVNYTRSLLDSGSNGVFFDDRALAICGDFYCPPGGLVINAAIVPAGGGAARPVDLAVDSISVVTTQRAASVAGPITLPPAAASPVFIWGLPFHYGRSVYAVRDGAASPAGTGPFWAW